MHDLLMDFIFDLSEGQQALIMFGSMVLMIVLAVPIPIAVAIGTAIGYFMMDLNLVQVVLSMYTGVEPFPLVTVPLFVFAGSLMEQGGMARRIVNMAQSMIGNYTGSLGSMNGQDVFSLNPRALMIGDIIRFKLAGCTVGM